MVNILNNDIYQLIPTILGAGGVYGNGDLFSAVPDGIQVTEPVIVSIMLWAKDNTPATEPRYLAVQLDKQQGAIDPVKVLTRVPNGFIWNVASAVYNGILLAGDIVRGVAMAPSTGASAFSIIDGYASVLGVPVAITP